MPAGRPALPELCEGISFAAGSSDIRRHTDIRSRGGITNTESAVPTCTILQHGLGAEKQLLGGLYQSFMRETLLLSLIRVSSARISICPVA